MLMRLSCVCVTCTPALIQAIASTSSYPHFSLRRSKAPPIKGVVPIILSWFFSPILTACASAVIYGLNVFFVLRSEHSTSRSVYVLPILVFSTVMIDIYFVFTKGAKKSFAPDDDWSDSKVSTFLNSSSLGACPCLDYFKSSFRRQALLLYGCLEPRPI